MMDQEESWPDMDYKLLAHSDHLSLSVRPTPEHSLYVNIPIDPGHMSKLIEYFEMFAFHYHFGGPDWKPREDL